MSDRVARHVGPYGQLLQEEKQQLEKLELHGSIVLADQAPPLHPASHSLSWSIPTAAKPALSLLGLALALPQIFAFNVHSSFQKCFQSYFRRELNWSKALHRKRWLHISSRGYVTLWYQNLPTKGKSIYGHKWSVNNSEEHTGQRECCDILLTSFYGLKKNFFFADPWTIGIPALFCFSTLEQVCLSLFESMTCSQKSRGWIQSGVWWEIKWGVPPLVTDWSSHLSPADGVASGESHDPCPSLPCL